MPISTQCPHCGRAFKLKDELAGKRVTCSKCRKAFAVAASAEPAAVPAAAGHAPADAESLALSVLAEETVAKKEEAKPAAPEAEPIVVKCEHCDFADRFQAPIAGKKDPVATCRH